jgi:hypothetical protein
MTEQIYSRYFLRRSEVLARPGGRALLAPYEGRGVRVACNLANEMRIDEEFYLVSGAVDCGLPKGSWTEEGWNFVV